MKKRKQKKTMEPSETNQPNKQNTWTSKLSALLQNKKALPLILFVVGFGVVGIMMLFRSFALGNSTISGIAFKDLNRNAVMDAGEEPMSNQQIYLFNSSGVNTLVAYTDVAGNYSFTGLGDGEYKVAYAAPSWGVLKYDWTPTTTGSYLPEKLVTVAGTSPIVNFGWRQIVRSTDVDTPISKLTTASGLQIRVYNDVIQPQQIVDILNAGMLVGEEAASVSISFDHPNQQWPGAGSTAAVGYQGPDANGKYSNVLTSIGFTWSSWTMGSSLRDGTLFHEYGHAWGYYYTITAQNDPMFSEYLKARGLYGDARINTGYEWRPTEIIADDYRILFGTPQDANYEHMNPHIPEPKDVQGLREYLSGTFMNGAAPPPGGLIPPTNVSGVPGLSAEGPYVQLSWAASNAAARYDVYRNNTKLGEVYSPSTTYYDNFNLSYGTQYTYYLKAVDSAGNQSQASTNALVNTPPRDTQKPTTPSGLSTTGATNNSISLQWTASTDNVSIKEYQVYQEGSRKTVASLKGTATGTNFTVTGLKANTGYIFYVTAVDSAGNESSPSKTLSVKTRR